MNAFLTLLFLAVPFLLLAALVAFLTVPIGTQTKPPK
jgi:hypothetical protein